MSAAHKQTLTALEEFDRLPDAAHVRYPVVAALYGVSPETIRRHVIAGNVPAPKKLLGVTAWNVGDLRRALAANTVAA